jgi:chromosomal replication initiator protein
MYIASKIKSNFRELEGALVRLIAYCSLTGSDVQSPDGSGNLTISWVQVSRGITIEMIQKGDR